MKVLRVALLAVAAACCARPELAAAADPKQALALAQQYLARWESQLSAIVAEETYLQTIHASYNHQRWRAKQRRRLRSDVLLVSAPADSLWLCFRDVVSVDNVPVPDRQDRFDALFTGPAASILADAKRIGEESARFNLGFHRTVNTPVAALVFLSRPFASSTTWELAVNRRLGKARAWALEFKQRTAPFAVHGWENKPLPSSGRIWIEPGSGRILRTELVVDVSGRPRVTTEFAYVPDVDAWAPIRMEDRFDGPNERISGLAHYTKHRAFRTAGRILR